MPDIERRLANAMRAAVDGELPPAGLVAAVRRRHRRYRVRVAGVAAASVIAVVAVPVAVASRLAAPGIERPGLFRSVSPPASGSATSGRASRTSSPRPSQSSGHARQHRPPVWMRGLPLAPTTNLRLLLDGRDPAWISTATGGTQPIAGLPRSFDPYSLWSLGGGWAATPSRRAHACVSDCPGPLLPVYYIADGSATARRIGTAQQVAPGSQPGTLWLQSYPRHTADVTSASATEQEVTDSGHQVGGPVRLPVGYSLVQAVGRYLLLTPDSQGPGTVTDELWDPGTRRVVRTFGNVIAASGSQVAWGICEGCAVHVLDVLTGVSFAVPVPGQNWAFDGTFSADGRLLAVYLSADVNASGLATGSRIAVISVTGRRLRVLRGSTVSNGNRTGLAFGWLGGTDQLVAMQTGAGPRVQIGYWRPGGAWLRVAWLWPPPGTTVVVGPY